MGNEFQFAWEVSLIETMQELLKSYPFLKQFFSLFTIFGDSKVVVLFVIFIYWSINKDLGRKLAVYNILSVTCNGLIKNIFKRIRPYAVNDSIECLKPVEKGYDIYDMSKQGFSFPSGHATVISGTMTGFYRNLKDKKILFLGIILTFFVGMSRFVLGVHYPTDVIAGVIFGLAAVYVVDYLFKHFGKKKAYAVIFMFDVLGVFYCKSNDYYSVLGLQIGFFLGDLFDDKYVNFKTTRNPVKIILRVVFGSLIYLGLYRLLKLPFSAEVLEAHNYFAYLYRTFRYAVMTFVIVGLYPILFKYNIFRLKDKNAD